ncbi:MAG TPA: 4-hydroxy-tetrahydrodipicolinate synthase [Sediminibacterium sp.]|nr:4-hydroxy-tetrahydrodipicolinate synthase [Sediminibacterium sp.]
MSLRQQLQGTGVALVTPFTETGAVDFAALSNVIEAQIAGGVNYLVSLGTTGETPTLDKQEKKDIIQFTLEVAAGRIPVVVGVGGNHTTELVKDLETLPLDKAVAVLSASPYYSKPSQEGIFQHYQVLAAASPKPIILYNVPGRTGRNISAQTTLRLAREVPNILGMKEASGDMAQCMLLLRDLPPEFLLVSGDDALALPQIACGMQGVISVAANAFPSEFAYMVKLCLEHRFAEAKQVNDPLLEAYELMFAENNPAGVKAFMAEKGLLQNYLRLPLTPLSAGLHQKIREYLKK